MVTFLHISDLHLDRSFEGHMQPSADFLQKLSSANEATLHRIGQIAIENQVDFILMTGDNFHQSTSSIRSQRLLHDFFTTLAENKIDVYLTFGNHDYYQPDRFWFEFPDNVHIWTSESIETYYHTLPNKEVVAISSFSYTQPWINENKALDFPRRKPQESHYHIGMYHGDVGQQVDTHRTQQYAPTRLSDLLSLNYDYWALGHIHVPTVLKNQPPIIYAGTPQGHNKKEQDVRGILLVNLEKNKVTYQWQPVATVSYQTLTLSLDERMTKQKSLETLRLQINERLVSLEYATLLFLQIEIENEEVSHEEWLEQIQADDVIEALQAEFPTLTILDIKRLHTNKRYDARLPLPLSARDVSQNWDYIMTHKLKDLKQPLWYHRDFERLELGSMISLDEVEKQVLNRFEHAFSLQEDEHDYQKN